VDFLLRDGSEANVDVAIAIDSQRLENSFITSISNISI